MALQPHSEALAGRHIAVPESRELDVLEQLFVRRGAKVRRCPLLTIVDAPDESAIAAWITDFIRQPPDYFILMTGEGLSRLLSVVERRQMDADAFRGALLATTLVCRGPKPARVLRKLGIAVDVPVSSPTTDGVIDALQAHALDEKSVALQLYGEDPNERLVNYLRGRNAQVTCIAPYRYAPESSEQNIRQVTEELASGALDAIVFTSKAQVERIFAVAERGGFTETLRAGLLRSTVAAIGPVVQDALAEAGFSTEVAPDGRYFMKPLVAELCKVLGPAEAVTALGRDSTV